MQYFTVEKYENLNLMTLAAQYPSVYARLKKPPQATHGYLTANTYYNVENLDQSELI